MHKNHTYPTILIELGLLRLTLKMIEWNRRNVKLSKEFRALHPKCFNLVNKVIVKKKSFLIRWMRG